MSDGDRSRPFWCMVKRKRPGIVDGKEYRVEVSELFVGRCGRSRGREIGRWSICAGKRVDTRSIERW